MTVSLIGGWTPAAAEVLKDQARYAQLGNGCKGSCIVVVRQCTFNTASFGHVSLVSLSLTSVATFAVCQMSLFVHRTDWMQFTVPTQTNFRQIDLSASPALHPPTIHCDALLCCSRCSCSPVSRQQRATASRLIHRFPQTIPHNRHCQHAR